MSDVEAHELAVGGEVVERRVGAFSADPQRLFLSLGDAKRQQRGRCGKPIRIAIRMIVLSLLSRPSFQTALWRCF